MKRKNICILNSWTVVKLLFIFFAFLFTSAISVRADGYKSVYVPPTLPNWDNGVEHWSDSEPAFTFYFDSTMTLKAKRNNKVIDICKKFSTGYVYTNGNIVFYAIRSGYNTGLRRIDLSTGKVKKIANFYDKYNNFSLNFVRGKYAYYCPQGATSTALRKIDLVSGKITKIKTLASSSSYAPFINLVDIYNNEMYYVLGICGSEGDLMRINLKTKAIRKVNLEGHLASSVKHYRNGLFLMTDGTGAGSSYLGMYDANKNKFKVITGNPENEPIRTSKYIYYIENTGGTLSVAGPFKVAVRRYNISTGERKTLVKSLDIGFQITKFTTKYIQYKNSMNGSVITKKW